MVKLNDKVLVYGIQKISNNFKATVYDTILNTVYEASVPLVGKQFYAIQLSRDHERLEFVVFNDTSHFSGSLVRTDVHLRNMKTLAFQKKDIQKLHESQKSPNLFVHPFSILIGPKTDRGFIDKARLFEVSIDSTKCDTVKHKQVYTTPRMVMRMFDRVSQVIWDEYKVQWECELSNTSIYKMKFLQVENERIFFYLNDESASTFGQYIYCISCRDGRIIYKRRLEFPRIPVCLYSNHLYESGNLIVVGNYYSPYKKLGELIPVPLPIKYSKMEGYFIMRIDENGKIVAGSNHPFLQLVNNVDLLPGYGPQIQSFYPIIKDNRGYTLLADVFCQVKAIGASPRPSKEYKSADFFKVHFPENLNGIIDSINYWEYGGADGKQWLKPGGLHIISDVDMVEVSPGLINMDDVIMFNSNKYDDSDYFTDKLHLYPKILLRKRWRAGTFVGNFYYPKELRRYLWISPTIALPEQKLELPSEFIVIDHDNLFKLTNLDNSSIRIEKVHW